jgi:hypothetical protein
MMESLPDELQCAIASLLPTTTDLAAYRLVGKRFAHIGAESLFERFECGPNTSTLTRLHHLLQSPLGRCVKTIDYKGTPAFHDPMTPHGHAFDVQVFEKVVKGFGQQLRTLWVPNIRPEVFAEAVDEEFVLVCKRLTCLTLCFDRPPQQTSRRTARLKQDLEKKLCRILRGLGNVDDLTLHLDDSLGESGSVERLHRLSDVIPMECVWSNLRRFEIYAFVTTPKDLVHLLKAHKDTLRCVHLDHIVLNLREGEDGGRAWREVFEVLRGMEELDHGTVLARDGKGEREAWMIKGSSGRDVVIMTNLRPELAGGVEE